jgi:pilus assembly protein Flp/PilA
MLAHLPFVIRSLASDRRGASSAEYAVVAALISIAAITAMATIGQEIQNKLTIVANGFN